MQNYIKENPIPQQIGKHELPISLLTIWNHKATSNIILTQNTTNSSRCSQISFVVLRSDCIAKCCIPKLPAPLFESEQIICPK